MFIAYGQAELYLPHCNSLKEKRSLVKGLTERLKKRFSISVGEVAHVELWQRARLGFSIVSSHYNELDFMINTIRETMYDYSDQLEVMTFDHQIEKVFDDQE